MQAFGQVPQWLTLLVVSTSHPSLGSLLQSARPDSHIPTAQPPAPQVALP
jgi:hypothetical protein